MKEEFNLQNISKNNANFYENNLVKTFTNNNGKNEQYPTVDGFNNTTNYVSSSNNTGIEYFGQAMINGYKNGQMYREYFDEDIKSSSNSGFESSFLENELFMKLSDTNVTNKDNVIGRITKLKSRADKFDNIEIDYDLFTENLLNFKIGDIIIDLDSNTIGVILPYDYNYNSLPNTDIVSLGIGAYLMNKSKTTGSFIEKYASITNASIITWISKKFK